MRSGPIAPAHDFQTAILSDHFNENIAKQALDGFYDNSLEQEHKLDLSEAYRLSQDVPLLQAQNLQIYSIRNEGANGIVGKFLQRQEIGLVAGRKIPAITHRDLCDVGMILEGQLDKLPDQDQDLIPIIQKLSVENMNLGKGNQSDFAE